MEDKLGLTKGYACTRKRNMLVSDMLVSGMQCTLHAGYNHTAYKHIPVISIHFSGPDLFPIDFNGSDYQLCA